MQGLSVPVVEVGGATDGTIRRLNIPCFASDNQAIARLAVNHLLDRGFRRLAYCGFPGARHNRWSEERAAAFKRRAREAGCRSSVYVGRYETARMAGTATRPDGLAAGAGNAGGPDGLQRRSCPARAGGLPCPRLRVPEDVAVVGVDNDEVMCELTDPPLSSIEQGMRRLGYQAAALLDQRMEGKESPQMQYVVGPEGVVARRSTDTLAVSNAEVALAARFIREHACDGISIADLTKMAGLSRSTLERKFKAMMGRTIHAEIDRVRIERARTLLAETDLPLKQVAARAGFKYIQYMSTLFRRRLDQTPADTGSMPAYPSLTSLKPPCGRRTAPGQSFPRGPTGPRSSARRRAIPSARGRSR